MDSLQRRALTMSFAAMETTFAAVVTIAARTPVLVASMTPGRQKAADVVESQRMVMEKVEAAIEGAAAAQVALMTLWARMFFGTVRGPTAFAHGLADVAHAATHPAHRRVRANAKRLVGNTLAPRRRGQG
jgi:hypothetical protein